MSESIVSQGKNEGKESKKKTHPTIISKRNST